MPAWRTASSRAASRGVRSGSRSPPSAGEREAHADAGQRLRDDGPPQARAGQPRQREHAAADQRAARRRARARVAAAGARRPAPPAG